MTALFRNRDILHRARLGLVHPTPDPAKARIVAEVERRKVSLVHPLVLKRIMQNPVPKPKREA